MQQKLGSVYYLNKLKQRALRWKLGREVGRGFGSSQGGEGKYERNALHTYMKLISQRTKHNESKTIMKRTHLKPLKSSAQQKMSSTVNTY